MMQNSEATIIGVISVTVCTSAILPHQLQTDTDVE